jgi:hypothetical protein
VYLRDLLMVQCGLASSAFLGVPEQDQGLDVRTCSLTLLDAYGRHELLGLEFESRRALTRTLEALLEQAAALGLRTVHSHPSMRFLPGTQTFLWSARGVHRERNVLAASTGDVAAHAPDWAALMLAPGLRSFMRGYTFLGLALGEDGAVLKTPVQLEYLPAPHPGQLRWTGLGGPGRGGDCTLRLDALTAVYLGKHSPVFAAPACAALDPACCLSLLTHDETIDIYASSPAVARNWLCALAAALQAHKLVPAMRFAAQPLVVATHNLLDMGCLGAVANRDRAAAVADVVAAENDMHAGSIFGAAALSQLLRATATHKHFLAAAAPPTATHALALHTALHHAVLRTQLWHRARAGVAGMVFTSVPDAAQGAGPDLRGAEWLSSGDPDDYVAAVTRTAAVREAGLLFLHSASPTAPATLSWCSPDSHPRVCPPLQTIPLESVVSVALSLTGPSLVIVSPALRGVCPQDALVFQSGERDALVGFAHAVATLHEALVGDRGHRAVAATRAADELMRDVAAQSTAAGLAVREAALGEEWDADAELALAATEGVPPGQLEVGYPYAAEGGALAAQPQVLAVSAAEEQLALRDHEWALFAARRGEARCGLEDLLSGVQLSEFPFADTAAMAAALNKGKGSGGSGGDTLTISADADERDARLQQSLEDAQRQQWLKAQARLDALRAEAAARARAAEEEARLHAAALEAAAAEMAVEIEYVVEEEDEEEEAPPEPKALEDMQAADIDDRVKPPSIWEIIAARASQAQRRLAEQDAEIEAASDDEDDDDDDDDDERPSEAAPAPAPAPEADLQAMAEEADEATGPADADAPSDPAAAPAAAGTVVPEGAAPTAEAPQSRPASRTASRAPSAGAPDAADADGVALKRRSRRDIWQASLSDAAEEERIIEELLVKARESRRRAEEQLQAAEAKRREKKAKGGDQPAPPQ